jgi:hypothetical protein
MAKVTAGIGEHRDDDIRDVADIHW